MEQSRQSAALYPLRTDGGSSTQYVWYDPDTEAVLYHTGVNDDAADPFFANIEEADRYLEQRADQGEQERYERLSLYKVRMRKEQDALDVLLDQAGLDDFERFAPDGGSDPQIGNPHPETVYFWYDPSVDLLVQAEVDPYDVRGMFTTEADAYRFLGWYADQYAIEDTTRFELYAAELEHRGCGLPAHEDDGETQDIDEPPEQAAFDTFSSEQTGTNPGEENG
jgi:hypothetical protein